MNCATDIPALTDSRPNTLDLPPAVLACLLHRELTRLATVLDGVPDLEEAEVVQIPAGVAYRIMALGTATLKCLSVTRPAGSS